MIKKAHILLKKGPNWWKMKKIIFLDFFKENMEKCRKKWKMIKKGHILLKKAQIDETGEKQYFLDFFKENMEKCRIKWKMIKNGHIDTEKGPNWWKMRIIIFSTFFGKIWKSVGKSEKWSKRVIYCLKRPKLMKNEKKNIFWLFSKKIWKKVGKSEKWSKRVIDC